MPEVAVLGAPSSLGAHTAGQERAPAALRRAGLLEALTERGLEVHDLGDLGVRRWTPDRASPHAQNVEAVAEYALEVAAAVAEALTDGRPLLVLGGDCTIELGIVSGLLRAGGAFDLAYLDAGPDLNVPSSVREGFLDWMGMAHALDLPGAADPLRGIGPRTPLLQPDEVVFVAVVPDELTEWERQQLEAPSLRVHWSDEVADDPVGVARAVTAHAKGERLAVHFDIDVVDFLDFPAADFPTINAGLTLAQALSFVAEVARDPRFAVLTVCEINPDHLDEEGVGLRRFAGLLADALAP